jgi:hypothetical protein
MSNYLRKAGTVNLVVGIVLILLGAGSMISLTSRNISGANLGGPMSLVLLFIFLGRYETGKYASLRSWMLACLTPPPIDQNALTVERFQLVPPFSMLIVENTLQ